MNLTKMNAPKIVGFAGGAGCGKSVAAKTLVEMGYARMAFADPLKSACYEVFGPLGAKQRHFFGSQADKAEPIPKLGGVTGRRILEVVGTEGFRAAYSNVWVERALVTRDPTDFYVIEDVRFQNEIDAIRAAGGEIILLRRDGVNPPALDDGSAHESARWWRLKVDATWTFAEYGSVEGFTAVFREAFEGRLRVGSALSAR